MQQFEQVRDWQVLAHPDEETAPRVHSAVPEHSHPFDQDPSQLLYPELQMQVPDEQVA